jgi:hypothetical protein
MGACHGTKFFDIQFVQDLRIQFEVFFDVRGTSAVSASLLEDLE